MQWRKQASAAGNDPARSGSSYVFLLETPPFASTPELHRFRKPLRKMPPSKAEAYLGQLEAQASAQWPIGCRSPFAPERSPMDRINPQDLFRFFDRLYVEI